MRDMFNVSRIDVSKLIEIQKEFGEFEIGSQADVKEGRNGNHFAVCRFILRFGYWRSVDVERLQSVMGGRYSVSECWDDDDDCGRKFYYEVR